MTPIEKAERALRQGDLAHAQSLCRALIEKDPRDHAAFWMLSRVADQDRRLDLAVKFAQQACHLAPQEISYRLALTDYLYRTGAKDDAFRQAQAAVQDAPNDPQAQYNLGVLLAERGDASTARTHYETCLKLDPDHAGALFNLASLFEREGDLDRAVDFYRELIAKYPENAHAHNNLGNALAKQGYLEDARLSFETAIGLDADFVDPHLNLSSLKTYRPNDPQLAAMEHMAAKIDRLAPEKAPYLWFALGKAREDAALYDEAFAAYREGNRLMHETHPYNEAETAQWVDTIEAQFTVDLFDGYERHGCQDDTPIFIVGMPRSGTTLVEQILASHSSVHGGDELTFLAQTVEEGFTEFKALSLPDLVRQMTPHHRTQMGERYRDWLRTCHATAPHITDKMPSNYLRLGLIPLILPKAKIIHIERDPMDTCFSNFARLFQEAQLFTYDLTTLGREYKRYERLMAHWRKIMPPGSILHMSYENLVADLEGNARRLLEYCGLSWEDRVLAFHETERPISTASRAQVKKPIYNSSVARWRRFEKHLGPLRDALSR